MGKNRKVLIVALLLLAILGLIDSVVIHEKVSGAIYASCIVGQGCDSVLYSSYSNFLGVPLSWWGIVFYSILVLLLSFLVIGGREVLAKSIFLMITAGFIFSLYLFYIQVFKLGILCTYCMISFSDMVLAMTLAEYSRRKTTKSLQG